MAQTQISDLVPSEKVLGQLVSALISAKNAFINSGAAVGVADFNPLASGGAHKQSLPYVKPLDASEFNISNDDNEDTGNTSKVQADEFTAVRLDLNNGYTYADLVQMVTRASTNGLVQNGLAAYWNAVNQKVGVASIKGALAATSASALTVGSTSTAFSFGAVIDGAATAGENMDMFKTLIVHSTTYANILKAYKPVLDPQTGLLRVGGYNLIIDNSFGDTATILVRDGALALAFASPDRSIEIARNAGGGNGGGAETLWTRLSQVVHPQGFNFVGDVPTGSNTSGAPAILDALSDGDNWTMKLAANQVGIRMVQHSNAAFVDSKHVIVDNIGDTPVA